jgi:hypothetical protein
MEEVACDDVDGWRNDCAPPFEKPPGIVSFVSSRRGVPCCCTSKGVGRWGGWCCCCCCWRGTLSPSPAARESICRRFLCGMDRFSACKTVAAGPPPPRPGAATADVVVPCVGVRENDHGELAVDDADADDDDDDDFVEEQVDACTTSSDSAASVSKNDRFTPPAMLPLLRPCTMMDISMALGRLFMIDPTSQQVRTAKVRASRMQRHAKTGLRFCSMYLSEGLWRNGGAS